MLPIKNTPNPRMASPSRIKRPRRMDCVICSFHAASAQKFSDQRVLAVLQIGKRAIDQHFAFVHKHGAVGKAAHAVNIVSCDDGCSSSLFT